MSRILDVNINYSIIRKLRTDVRLRMITETKWGIMDGLHISEGLKLAPDKSRVSEVFIPVNMQDRQVFARLIRTKKRNVVMRWTGTCWSVSSSSQEDYYDHFDHAWARFCQEVQGVDQNEVRHLVYLAGDSSFGLEDERSAPRPIEAPKPESFGAFS